MSKCDRQPHFNYIQLVYILIVVRMPYSICLQMQYVANMWSLFGHFGWHLIEKHILKQPTLKCRFRLRDGFTKLYVRTWFVKPRMDKHEDAAKQQKTNVMVVLVSIILHLVCRIHMINEMWQIDYSIYTIRFLAHSKLFSIGFATFHHFDTNSKMFYTTQHIKFILFHFFTLFCPEKEKKKKIKSGEKMKQIASIFFGYILYIMS